MSAIYKLSIQGIRSFDSNDRETIEFGKPLTLIVGMNGSGKTTIIECLKYATTGDLPPNSKGGVFVHDPKITGERDVRAQVKLAFTSANGITMIVTRNIQLLAKKTTNTFKTLEGQLAAINQNGDRSTLSTRSVELDTQVPLYLGVPKAILEYVIFCHQEDSLWPLSEPSNLKKNLNEIFQAMKFTKAIDNLKNIKKEMAIDIKLLKQSVEHLKVDRDRSKSTKMTIVQLQGQVDEYQGKVTDIEKELKKITEQSDKLFKSNQEFQKVLSKVQNLKLLETHYREEIDNLSTSIELLSSSKQSLQELLSNFSTSLQEKENEVLQTENKITTLKNKANVQQSELTKLIRRQGELQAGKESYEKNTNTLQTMAKEFSSRYKINFSDTDSMDSFIKLSSDFVSSLSVSLLSYESEATKAIRKAETRSNEATKSETIQRQRLEYSRKDLEKLNTEIEKLTSEFKNNEYTKEDLEMERKKLEDYHEKVRDWEKTDVITELNSKLKQKNDQMIISENELEQIQEKIMKTNQQADLFAKLGIMKKSLYEKTEALNELIEKFNDDPKSKEWGLSANSDIDIDFKKYFINMQKQIALNNKDIHSSNKEYTESSIRLSNTQRELKKLKSTEEEITKRLEESLPEDCPIDEYNDVVVEAELSYKTALENLKMHQTTLDFNRKALEIADRDNCCYLCARKFETDDFRGKILQQLRAKTDANFENTLKETVKEEKEYLDGLRALERDFLSLTTCKDDYKSLTSRVDEYEKDVSRLKNKFDEFELKGENLKSDRDYAERILRAICEEIVYLRKEVKSLEKNVQDVAEELRIYGDSDGGVQTVEELSHQQQEKNALLRQLRKDVQDLQNERESKTREHSALLTVIKERNLKVNEIERGLQRSENIKKDIIAKEHEVDTLGVRIQNLEEEINVLLGEKEIAAKLLNETRLEYNEEIESQRGNIDNIKRYLDRFNDLKSDVDTFSTQGFAELEDCTVKLAKVQEDLEVAGKNIEETQDELNLHREKLKDSNNEKKNLEQNLRLIELQERLKETEVEVSGLNIQNAEAERDKYQQESSRLRNLFERLSAENAGKMGEVKQLQSQIEGLKHQLRSDYKDIDDKYHKNWVELQTRTFVTDDIETYSKALDSAIMRYHGLKMQDINRIIDELWKRTYTGTDIDTIKIRSDEVTSGVRGKSYNYRVVMYKQDAELDMRGRCSAGQKVLASIIIRLALSETFGTNCGVIALDEPTTNLDEENIESLAKALNNIIGLRRHQKNFQLIVITHDEKFLNHMNASQFTDHFFRIKRDDRQKSQIEWVDISKVSE
ncbi:MRX complex DNA-binding subunit NDAI_0F04000 [Naumovozyma dairenensis CBS 421]|uniref:DNA repair protein RAD50 n=1 Tax=Naumovozyma dairenensis (strain ATCC 10597 / BCRC 20456 / CBS 421 / NBRC 0211 / NRRL Y-12639) TaxID=1071378 RepID=G0WD57_NAUDC|nr:hypothetical protein NDAI_0F04000 [Naumovozyma dairenensis CBS 421]CCD25718.1 hypothetical protein NDAI_0F04000 [Naumovozyma dairenensis CBS 421]